MDQEQQLTRQRVFSELVRSPHGKLEEYLPTGRQAAREDPEFFAHLVAWNGKKGQVRDSKLALPLIAVESMVSTKVVDPALMSNALAHLAQLSPRDLLRAVHFVKEHKLQGRRQAIPKLVKLYLRSLESNSAKFERTVVQHRRTVKELYAFCHVKPGEFSNSVLFEDLRAKGSTFDVIANLKNMEGVEAAGQVIARRIPFLVAAPALGKKLHDKDVLSALIGRMSPAELTIHMKMLEKLGVKKDPTLRGALEKALGKLEAGGSNALKLSQAVEALDDEDLKDKVQSVQEKKLDKTSVEGNWLVLGDKSGSMSSAIEMAKQVSAVLARLAKGSIYLVFFDNQPLYYDVTGKTLEQITALCSRIQAGGGTSIGVGARYASEKGLDVDGIAVISDGGENSAPTFALAYRELCKKLDREIPVYFYHVKGSDSDAFSGNCKNAGIELQKFDIGESTDYYSLPNLVTTMRTNRYSLVEEVMETPLLVLDQVLKLRQPTHA